MGLKDSQSFSSYMYRFARGLKCADHSAQDVYFELWGRFDKGHDVSEELMHEIGLCLNAGETDHVMNMLRLLLRSEQQLLGIEVVD